MNSSAICGIEINLLVHGYHLPLHEQLLNDSGRLDFHLVCQIANRHLLRESDGLDYILILLRFWLLLWLFLSAMLLQIYIVFLTLSAQLIMILTAIIIASVISAAITALLTSYFIRRRSCRILIKSI